MHCPRCHRRYPEGYRFCPVDGASTVEVLDAASVPSRPTSITDSLLARRYRIHGFIGAGAMARVYVAEDTETTNLVAVKVMDANRANDEARKRFLREANAVNKIGHPNIVRILEAGLRDDDRAPYLVMEFLFGEPMGSYLRREGKLSLELALPALQQAASALMAAHERGVVHRDVKPDNLFLVGEPGDPYELKVLDFGFSKLQTSDLTAAGIILGTPAYMAPEQALAEELDARTDIYALGMVMYHALTGQLPFEGDEVQVLARHIYADPVRPSQLSPVVDARIEAVITKATQKNPDERYASMRELLDDLGRLAQPGVAVQAEPLANLPYRPRSKLGRHVAEALGRAIGIQP